MNKKVIVGLSGGVDSSVAAYLLKKQGYDVIGLFMRNWNESDPDGACTAEEDFRDVRRVSDKLGIPYYTVDFSKEYYDKVFKLFVDEYSKGRTPNPDVLCNKVIKFDAFASYANSFGADYIATGHYAGLRVEGEYNYLLRAKDENKDQTYFLNQLSNSQLNNVLFPLSDITDKGVVRDIARECGLSTSEKKDSTGICFIGERNFRKFLSEYIPMREGDIVDLKGRKVGKHDGVFFYTIGQRHGLKIGGGGNGEPWFVVEKDVFNNRLIVNQGECRELYASAVHTNDFNYITKPLSIGEHRVLCRIRHRQSLFEGTLIQHEKGADIKFDKPVRGVALGQYAVCYIDDVCLGGGVIESKDIPNSI